LIGQYQLDIEPPASRAQAQLILKKDSTLILKEIPVGVLNVFYSDYTQDHNNLESITGNWKISEYKDDLNLSVNGYFGVMVPPVSVKQCHFERYCNYIKN
jgi:hypothetical protein